MSQLVIASTMFLSPVERAITAAQQFEYGPSSLTDSWVSVSKTGLLQKSAALTSPPPTTFGFMSSIQPTTNCFSKMLAVPTCTMSLMKATPAFCETQTACAQLFETCSEPKS